MKRSSVEMNRSSFRVLFTILILIALANLIPQLFKFSGVILFSKIGDLLSLILWALVLGLAINFWRRYENLRNFKESTSKLDKKLELLKSRYEKKPTIRLSLSPRLISSYIRPMWENEN